MIFMSNAARAERSGSREHAQVRLYPDMEGLYRSVLTQQVLAGWTAQEIQAASRTWSDCSTTGSRVRRIQDQDGRLQSRTL
jgi:hypothetical protein